LEQTKYSDIIKRRFRITKITKIERKDDKDSVWGKFTDFTSSTIDRLIEQGKNDAMATFS
jgi:hypothetical protein